MTYADAAAFQISDDGCELDWHLGSRAFANGGQVINHSQRRFPCTPRLAYGVQKDGDWACFDVTATRSKTVAVNVSATLVELVRSLKMEVVVEAKQCISSLKVWFRCGRRPILIDF